MLGVRVSYKLKYLLWGSELYTFELNVCLSVTKKNINKKSIGVFYWETNIELKNRIRRYLKNIILIGEVESGCAIFQCDIALCDDPKCSKAGTEACNGTLDIYSTTM